MLKNTEYYIIDTRTTSNRGQGRWVECKDLATNPEYKKLLDLEASRQLSDMFPRLPFGVNEAASNFHTDRMLKETEDLISKESPQDFDGLLYVKSEDLAKKLLQDLQSVDKDIKLSRYGLQFSTENKKVKK